MCSDGDSLVCLIDKVADEGLVAFWKRSDDALKTVRAAMAMFSKFGNELICDDQFS